MKGAYIFDLDGTLCDATPRYKKYVEAGYCADISGYINTDYANGDWQTSSPTGLSLAAVENIICADKFYSMDKDNFYTSSDGLEWTSMPIANVSLKQLLFKNSNKIFALANDSVVIFFSWTSGMVK
mgnify:CR=1 FL=1